MSKADEIKNRLNKKPNAANRYMQQLEEKHTEQTHKTEENPNEHLEKLKQMNDRKKVEDTHSRQTFLVKKELVKELNQLAKKKRRGFKTEFINYAIEKAIREIEEQ